jgi:hypothetical protein
MSTQPSVGGPIYWIRNIVYHAPGGSTRMTAGSPGVLFYHNTVTTETSAGSSANAHWRNNLMLGQDTAPAIFSVTTSTSYSSSDYNGFRQNSGAAVSFRWHVGPPPAPGGAAAPGFATLAEYTKATRQDQNSVTLDYDVFMNVPKLDRDPRTVQRLYDFKDLDFRLKPGASAIDRGVALPNINDGFAGKAPDLGALEAGQPLPIYGPRGQ